MGKSYNRRVWLNSSKSSSTGSVVCFFGKNVEGRIPKKLAYVEISDCHQKVWLHQSASDTDQMYFDKVKLLRDELSEYLKFLKTR